jgi:hypothetical protein
MHKLLEMDRRVFLHGAAAALASGALGASPQTVPGPRASGKPRRVGLIGCGWYGKIDLLRLIQVEPVEVVSLCDVDERMLADAAAIVASRQVSGKTPKTYRDFRKMLSESGLDIVLIGVPDHWHALIMIEAAKAGADIYVQKPISADVREGAAMLAAARKYNRVVQVGTQRRSTPHLAEAKKLFLDEGKLGKIALVEIYCYYHMRATANPPDSTPPEWFAHAAVQQPDSSARVARLYAVRQRNCGRHVRSHAGHDALDDESGLAHAHRLHGRHSGGQEEPREYLGYANRHL